MPLLPLFVALVALRYLPSLKIPQSQTLLPLYRSCCVFPALGCLAAAAVCLKGVT